MKDASGVRLQCELCLIELSGLRSAAPALVIPAAPVSVAAAKPPETPAAVREPSPVPPAIGEEAAPPVAAEETVPPVAAAEAAPAPRAPSPDHRPWSELLELLRKELPVHLSVLLGDESSVRGRWEGDELHIEAQPGFYMDSLGKPEMLEKLGAICGAAVRVEELRPVESAGEDKLSALEKFNTVTFK